MSNKCKGCKAFDKGGCLSGVEPKIGDYICPCSICIVKIMCRGICDAYVDYAYKFSEFQRMNPTKAELGELHTYRTCTIPGDRGYVRVYIWKEQ